MRNRILSYSAILLPAFALACGSSADATSGASGNYGPSTNQAGGNGNTSGGGGSTAGNPSSSSPRPQPVAPEGQTDGQPPACASLDSSKPSKLYLSADDSNSMASPVIARRMLRQGSMVPANIIRTYEFLNYYNVRYAQGGSSHGVRLVPQLKATPSGDGYELQIGVQADPAASARRPMNITLVLDTSGSMGGQPIQLQAAAARALTSSLKAGDVISITTWNTNQLVALSGHAVSGPNDDAVLSVINSLSASGGTNLHAGLVEGYKLANKHYSEDRINRVVLISDGQANVGVTDKKIIGDAADDQNRDGIYLVGVGVGPGLNDRLMDTVTDAGKGAYVYLDTAEEAKTMFTTRFPEVMQVAARDIQVSMQVPWYLTMARFYGEEYSTDPSKVRPQNLAPGDAMVFSQVLKACDSSEVNSNDPIEIGATWLEPLTYHKRSALISTTLGALLSHSAPELLRGRAIVAYAEALKQLPSTSPGNVPKLRADVVKLIDAADPSGADPQLQEIRQLTSMM